MKRSSDGFTLIELLVVIAIIGVLASVIIASLDSARAKGQDAVRKSDLTQIATALELYYNNHGTFIVSGSGSGGGGNGWLSFSNGTSYPISVAQGLVNDGDIGAAVIDPSGQTTSNATTHSGFMIYASATNYTLWANLQNPSATDLNTLNNCYSSVYDGYSSTYPAAAQMNYCISN